MREPTPAQIQEAARLAHEVNRGYCQFLGDDSQLPYDQAPDWQKLSALNGVMGIAEGTIKTPGDSHRSWLAQKYADGWSYGPVKDPEKKEHPCMVPFGELPADQQAKDFLFMATVQAVLWPPEPAAYEGDAVDLMAKLDKLYEPHRFSVRSSSVIGTDAEGLAAYGAAAPAPRYANSRLSGLGFPNLRFKSTFIVHLPYAKPGYQIVPLDDEGMPGSYHKTEEGSA